MKKELPKNWVETELENLFFLQYGKGISINQLTEEGFNVYGANGIIGKYSEFTYEKSKVIISCRGAASGVIHKTLPFSYISSNSIVLDEYSDELLNMDFVKYAMITLDKSNVITGTAQPQITIQLLKNLHFPLPPLAEQRRIVAKLDTLFAQLEGIKTAMAKVPELLKTFRQQVLTQAVTGKLTEEWREGKELEGSDELIQRIIDKRLKDFELKCKIAKEKGERKPTKIFLDKLPEIEPIDTDLPSNWFQTNVHFLSFVTKLAGFEYSEHFDLREEGDIPVIRAQNVQMGRFEDKNRLYISKDKSDYLVRSQLYGREILMVFIGAGTGNVCLAPKNERWHLAPNVAKIDVDGISTEYLYLYLQSPLGVENVLSRVKATAQPSLSMETIREIVALIPPFEEQQEIVTRVESLFAKADAIEKQYDALKAKIDTLPQAILHKAFKGELTQQLDTDGDAKELLREIEQLREAQLDKGKKTTKKLRPKV